MLKAVREACQDQLLVDRMAEAHEASKHPPRRTTPIELLLRIVLVATESHFEHRGLVDETRMEGVLTNGKTVLYKSHQESDVRYVVL